MKISTIVKIKKGYVWIDTCSLDSPLGNMIDLMGFGNDDAIGSSFETMVFPCNEIGEVQDWEELDKKNYQTEEEAKKGHQAMVKKWKKK